MMSNDPKDATVDLEKLICAQSGNEKQPLPLNASPLPIASCCESIDLSRARNKKKMIGMETFSQKNIDK